MGFFPDIKLLVLNVNLSLTDRTEEKGAHRLIRKQASLFLHGATGSGKTTMLERATGRSLEDLQQISRTLGKEIHLVGKKGEPTAFVVDHGGEQNSELTKSRIRSLNQLKPLAILLLLDHAPRTKETNPSYKCPSKGILPEDESDPVRMRFEQHRKAIDELSWVFSTSPSLGERCRLVLPIVNKRDAWENMGYTIHIFTDWYFDALTQLTSTLASNNVGWHRPIPLAGKWEGFGKSLDIVRRRAGDEFVIKLAENPFFTAVIRVPVAQKQK